MPLELHEVAWRVVLMVAVWATQKADNWDIGKVASKELKKGGLTEPLQAAR